MYGRCWCEEFGANIKLFDSEEVRTEEGDSGEVVDGICLAVISLGTCTVADCMAFFGDITLAVLDTTMVEFFTTFGELDIETGCIVVDLFAPNGEFTWGCKRSKVCG